MIYPNVQSQDSPYATNTKQGYRSDPINKILDVLHTVAKSHQQAGAPQPVQQSAQPQQNVWDKLFDPMISAGIPDAVRRQNAARGPMDDASAVYDNSQQKLIDMITAPRAAMPTQQPAMGKNEALIAALISAGGALANVRPQFLQQGIQGYTGAREQKAQMDYANQTNAYNAQNDQLSRNIQGQQIQLSGDAQKFAMAKDYFDKAGGDLERAKELYRIDNQNAQNRRLDLAEKKSFDDAQTKNNISQWAQQNIKDTPSAKRALVLMKQSGNVPPEMETAILEMGAEGDRQLKQKGIQAAYQVIIRNKADAKRAAAKAGAKEGTPEYDGFMEIGQDAEDFYGKYRMTDSEKKEFWKYQNDVRNAGKFELLHDKQAFDTWKVGMTEMGRNARFGQGQQNQIDKTIYTQDSITARKNGTSTPTFRSDLTPEQMQSILKEFSEKTGFTITSTTGGEHNTGSRHYGGGAIDVRTRDKTPEEVNQMMSEAIQNGFRVFDERTRPPGQKVWSGPHVHIEIPKEVAPTRRDTTTAPTKKNTGKATTAPANNNKPSAFEKVQKGNKTIFKPKKKQ